MRTLRYKLQDRDLDALIARGVMNPVHPIDEMTGPDEDQIAGMVKETNGSGAQNRPD